MPDIIPNKLISLLNLLDTKKKGPYYVTSPSLPPFNRLKPQLKKIWDSGYLSNMGQYHQKLEKELGKYFGVPYLSLVNNGTSALVAALKSQKLKGEVITTPFTFVATANAISWCNLKPIFVDIDPDTFNLDPRTIERQITRDTSAIVGVHCYGNPCKVEQIKTIAEKYNLKVVYDAAHAFGSKYKGQSVLLYGDASALSFHATKIFNTFEGGAVITKTMEDKQFVDSFRNFGMKSELSLQSIGLNLKMSEFNAALGLQQLNYINSYIIKRTKIAQQYCKILENCRGIILLRDSPLATLNHAYFPVLISSNSRHSRDEICKMLQKKNIFARKYFYPLVSNIEQFREKETTAYKLTNAEYIAENILCLPIYTGLKKADVEYISSCLMEIIS